MDGFGMGNRRIRRSPEATLSATCQTRARTRAAAVGSERLTASAMAGPTLYHFLKSLIRLKNLLRVKRLLNRHLIFLLLSSLGGCATVSVFQWSEFLATDPEVPGSIPDATRFSE
jgi:hypothetical protein